jgi:desulfoferrodoxin (superoxide reductase-like protein)
MGHCVCCEPCFALDDTTPTCSLTSGEIYHSLHQKHHTFWFLLWIIDWLKLVGLNDANERKFTIENIFTINNTPITWCIKKQTCISLYFTKSKYYALVEIIKEAISRIKHLYQELGILKTRPIDLYCDNNNTIKISHNSMYHTKTKHFEIHLHFVKNMVERKEIRISCVSIDNQSVDILTKTLGKTKFENYVKLFNTYAILKS